MAAAVQADDGVSPRFVFGSLLGLMCCTMCLYYFKTPDHLKTNDIELSGPLGAPDADFEWCEKNFLSHGWVAEPVNTVTSLIYVLQALLFAMHHRRGRRGLPLECTVCLACVVAVGLGSTAFHATLRYPLQLADELPMLALVLAAVCWLMRPHYGTAVPRWCLGSFFFGLSAVLLGTLARGGRRERLHDVCRGLLSSVFSLCFIVIFWRGATVSRADAARRRELFLGKGGQGRAPAPAPTPTPTALFAQNFAVWIFTVLCWIADIVCCHALQNLPFGVPFPHLHGFWHLGSALGLQFTLALMLWHEYTDAGDASVRAAYWLGLVPYLVFDDGSAATRKKKST